MTARTAWRAVVAGAVTLVACNGAERQAASPLPQGPQVVEVKMSEFRYTYDPEITGGRVLFRVRNSGRLTHSLSLFPLADDIPPIDQQLRGSERRSIAPFAGTRAVDAGAATSFAVDLAPGVRYALACFVTDDQDRVHARLGMNSEFRAAVSSPDGGGRRRRPTT